MQVADKTVVIAGLGVSGTSLAEVLRERGAHVIGVDERKPEADLHSFDDVDWDHVDYVMSSPVFNPRTPFVLEAQRRGIPVMSEVEFAWQLRVNNERTGTPAPWIGITGTNGKTTTKELVHAVLSQKYRVYATQGNLNNHIGVPLTLLAMPAGIEFGIVEMGASAPGEIAALCRIAKPDYGIVTNIGKAHLEGFGDEEGVKAAKGELYDRLAADGGVAFVRQDDATLAAMAAQRPTLKTVRYGAEAADGLKSQLVGNYNRFNIAAAATIGRHFGVGEKELYGAIRDYAPTINRSQIIRTKNNIVIADCYNANPSSMRAALDWFGKLSPYDLDATKSEKIAILGDMLELGKWSAAEHRAILELILGMDFKRVVLIGQEFCDAAAAADLREATQKMSLMTFPDMDAALFYLRERLAYVKNKVVLLKGSRGMALERIVRYL